MSRTWLLKRLAHLGLLVTVPVSGIVAVMLSWNRVVGFLNSDWPPWVGNVASLLQIATPIVAIAWALTRGPRSCDAEPAEGGIVRVLRVLALLLPAHDRDRFVREVVANMADRQRGWQRLRELLTVAGAVPGLAVILRWARRRRA
jgi:hypothetical protein